jgi:starch synthase
MKNFSLYFDPDGYIIKSQRIMGRHAAGFGFLRAAVGAAKFNHSPLSACVPNGSAASSFSEIVKSISPDAEVRAFSVEKLAMTNQAGGLYVPGPGISRFASLRLRNKVDAFSIAGVTHTIASHAALSAIAELADSAVMPWDALICTSNSVRQSVEKILDSKIDFLNWRLRVKNKPELPFLPVIPLGVHSDDFVFNASHRNQARKQLGLNDDEIGLLFLGRLSFHAKAHPFPMFSGAENVVRKSGKKIVLIMCGWFANDHIRQAFISGANEYFPSGRTLFIDGDESSVLASIWAGSDIFVSLSDNIQESFGLTPIEAMAAGLPVLISDWNGYRDTVIDGVHGYRIPVTQGMVAAGEALSRKYEAGEINYDMYCGLSCMLVAVDQPAFEEKLTALVESPSLRASLGAAGKKHVKDTYDWRVVYQRYEALFEELREIRLRKGGEWRRSFPQGLHAAPDKQTPDHLFGHFSTRKVSLSDIFEITTSSSGSLVSDYRKLSRTPLFSFAQVFLPSDEVVSQFFANSGSTLASFAIATEIPPDQVIVACITLVKMGFLKLIPSGNSTDAHIE